MFHGIFTFFFISQCLLFALISPLSLSFAFGFHLAPFSFASSISMDLKLLFCLWSSRNKTPIFLKEKKIHFFLYLGRYTFTTSASVGENGVSFLVRLKITFHLSDSGLGFNLFGSLLIFFLPLVKFWGLV